MKYKNDEERRLAVNARLKLYRQQFPERRKEAKEKWRKKNLDKYAAYHAKWIVTNKETRAASMAEWQRKNAPRLNANKAARMAKRKKSMPAWANKFFIEEIYDLAQRRTLALGVLWSVDHIVPSKSHLVSGLHWEGNLRVIPHLDNISKKNRHWPDMP